MRKRRPLEDTKIWFTSSQSTSLILKDKEVPMHRKKAYGEQSKAPHILKRWHNMKASGQLHSPATQLILYFVVFITSPTTTIN